MAKFTKKLKRCLIQVTALVGVGCFMFGSCTQAFTKEDDVAKVYSGNVNRLTGVKINTNQENYYDSSVLYKLPETVEQDQEISVIIALNKDSVMDSYKQSNTDVELTDYVLSTKGEKVAKEAASQQDALIGRLKKSGISYKLGERYDTVLNGFEVTVKAKDFKALGEVMEGDAELIVGEVYEKAQTVPVNNDVDVYDTGIFDSSTSEYQGDGVVVAILDTGLDYTHTAFDPTHFDLSKAAFRLTGTNGIGEKVKRTVAAQLTKGLKGEDVYLNLKVPFAYDYADNDPDVLPLNSEHGTHVAGIIAGMDDEITGVAPNAQLAIMKVFSDVDDGAKTAWILSALEDCVTLGVDVINMSLGVDSGFTREVDKERVNKVYDSVREAGISLVVAAANSYNSAYSSEKNGNLGLTSNPDTGTVGSPSTYEAALSVASVDGVKTPYLLYGEEIIYFTEAAQGNGKERDFVSDILEPYGVDEREFEYVSISGVGRSTDYYYEDEYYKDKIVLVKRGTTTFEDKVRVALDEKGAAGIIIYNNVSGDISMSVGDGVGAVCSISQDNGEKLASAESGKIYISKRQVAGPFMSNFSSWGPTADLKIKPEITSHGGEIYSAVPGQGYDRLSGTSMAAPNLAGVTALIRQYVKYSGAFTGEDNENPVRVTSIVNQLMMSTADIVYNKNGLPYAVRKQGAGLVNINKATNTASYITTYDKKGNAMDKSKLELGDDKERKGVYTMTFDVVNFSNRNVSYDVNSIVMTEGVSETFTGHGETTVTQDGYLLSGSVTEILEVTGGTQQENVVSIAPNKTAKVTVRITLSQEDKEYLNKSFENGMYVEGFITLNSVADAEKDMVIPMLAFYGDWTEAPIFDEEYYDTNADELNKGLDPDDKLMADAYATKVTGGLFSDYIGTLGTYFFEQNPSATPIAANKEHISLSNQDDEYSATLNSIRYISAGLLRNAKRIDIVITEEATGKVVFERTNYNQRKSQGLGSIGPSSIEVDFSAIENDLKNNTRYNVRVEASLDYEGEQKNDRKVFEFPFYTDFEAPTVTDVKYRTEYDKLTKKTKLFADLTVYDNHYAMAMQLGQITEADEHSVYTFDMKTFGKYFTPIYSNYNATSTVTFELTNYVERLKDSVGAIYKEDGTMELDYNNNSFIAICYDYAMNSATYEIRLPDEIMAMYFTEDVLNLNINETKDLTTIMKAFPSDSWLQMVEFTSSDPSVVKIVNQTAFAPKQSTATIKTSATITATGYTKSGEKITATLPVHILQKGEDGYRGNLTEPTVNSFALTGYSVLRGFSASTGGGEIGETDRDYSFGAEQALSMFPSEKVKVAYELNSYFPDRTNVKYSSSNSKIATVTQSGVIEAVEEGTTIISINVTFDGKSTLYRASLAITVKDPFETSGMYLSAYRGSGDENGVVEIPAEKGVKIISKYAFSGYHYVDKDVEAGDVIDEEDPYLIKPMYVGDATITKVSIPEGVTEIQSYAFANLTRLEEVKLPTTLKKIGTGAFIDCINLKTINLENVQFINKEAFANCKKLQNVTLTKAVALGNYTFSNCDLLDVELKEDAQSLGIGTFYGNKNLVNVTFDSPKVKIGANVFQDCESLRTIDINAAVIASYAFDGCTNLQNVTLGQDVAVVDEYAFTGTKVAKFTLHAKNESLMLEENDAVLVKKSVNEETGDEEKTIVLVAPAYVFTDNELTTDATRIATGAFSGQTGLFYVTANSVTTLDSYAFAACSSLRTVSMTSLEKIGEYAFYECEELQTVTMPNVKEIGGFAFASSGLKTLPVLDKLETIGERAFIFTRLTDVTVPQGVIVGDYAFGFIQTLQNVTIQNDVTTGEGAFYYPINVITLADVYELLNDAYDQKTVPPNEFMDYVDATLAEYMDYYYEKTPYVYEVYDDEGNPVEKYYYYRYNYDVALLSQLKNVTIGNNVSIGNYAFFNAIGLNDVDLSGVKHVGDYAFSGIRIQDLCWRGDTLDYAFEREYVNGEIKLVDYRYTDFAPSFTNAKLNNATYVGEGSFASNAALNRLELNETLTEIKPYAFANCANLTTVTLPASVQTVGEYAFYKTGLTTVDLSNVNVIGDSAFARTPLTSVALKGATADTSGATIGDGAFAYAEELSTVTNLKDAVSIGANAFLGSALQEIDVTSATYIGDFAFAQSNVESVKFGTALAEIGENPFYDCNLSTFGVWQKEVFNGVEMSTQKLVTTYDISDTVKVIDEALYQVVPNGLELICYPKNNTNPAIKIADGTVRITARALAGSMIEHVTLPTTLCSIGDKAFYHCKQLKVVVFTSYNAPRLEEAYDLSYARTNGNAPYTTTAAGLNGLGIVPFYIWNLTSNYTNYYYGANFVDYIGHADGDLVMVKPTNGKNYESFIFQQYFSVFVNGAATPHADTQRVIDMINALPANVTLAHKDQILAARAAYDSIVTLEQRALITNLSKLTSAESALRYFMGGSSTDKPVEEPDTPNEPSAFAKFMKNNWVGLTIAGVILLGFIAYVTVDLLKKKKVFASAQTAETAEPEETVETEESAEPEKAETAQDEEEEGV